jgi:tetratricopeptide (TPR) repeat protein
VPKLTFWRGGEFPWLDVAGRRSALGWRILVLSGVVALLVLAADPPAAITVDYPENGSVFPPDITAPTFLWRDAAAGARLWRIDITFGDGAPGIRAVARGERMHVGEIDLRCVSDNNRLPTLTPQEAASWTWKPDAQTWAAIKKRSVSRAATVTIAGFADEQAKQPLSRGSVAIETSPDSVGAPIFYRDVPLMPSPTENGIIKPLDQTKLPLINWRLRNVGESRSRLLLTGMYTCANCHSFSRDGKTMGMDLDGPANDKGMYTLIPIRQQMSITTKDVIEWSTFEGKLTGTIRVGFMSQVSPDGQYVVTMIQGSGSRTKDSLNNFYTANFKDYRFLQVFYPTRGILAWYSRAAGKLQPLPGADDSRYVHTNVVWSPDGKYLVFARAAARDAYPPGSKVAERANDPNETQIQYDLYRIPFNGGRGGQPERILGASQNGMSNSFPKVSPDGRWIVFVKCRNGELMRPDGELYIIPATGGEARRLRANKAPMNSWHSFSPNGRWLVFSSKRLGPYTKMFLTHLDQEGNSSPAILIEDATAANRAVNIPEFVNIPPDGMQKIDVPATEFYRRYNVAWELAQKGEYEAALVEWKKALEVNSSEASTYLNLGLVQLQLGKQTDAIASLRKANELDPEFPEAQNDLGAILERTGQTALAEEAYRAALRIQPTLADAHANLANLLASRDQLAEAVWHYERAGEKVDQFHWGVTLARMNRTAEAQTHIEAALKADPNMAEAHDVLGGLMEKQGRFEAAVAEYREAVRIRPDLGGAHFDLGRVLAKTHDLAGAAEEFRKAATDPDPVIRQQALDALRAIGAH